MKGKEGSGDPKGREAKSGLASSGRGLDKSGEKGFFADEPVLLDWAHVLAAAPADHVVLLYPPGRQRPPIHPAPYHYQTPASMRTHHCHIPPSSQSAFPAPSRFWPPMPSLSAGLFDVAKLFPFGPRIASDVPAGLSIR